MKKLIIIRGLSGSGKSTKARELAGNSGLILSADNYFTKEGKYEFKASLLPEAHALCKSLANEAMASGRELVIIDNTNTRKWEYANYLEMASIYGYETEIQMVGNLTDTELYTKRNTHGVPKEAIERMAKRFES